MRRWDRSGFVLATVLAICAFASLIVAQLAVSTHAELELARSRARRAELRVALESGVSLARAVLAAEMDGEEPGVPPPWAGGPLRMRLGEVDCTLSIEDEGAKFPVSSVLGAASRGGARQRTMALESFVRDAAEAFGLEAAVLRAWVVQRRFRLNLPDKLAGEPLFRSAVHAPADGALPPEAQLTVWTAGSVNVNTAPAPVLRMAAGDASGRFVQALLKRRSDGPLQSEAEVAALAGLTRPRRGVQFATASSTFAVTVHVRAGPSRMARRVVLRRERGGVRVIARLRAASGRTPKESRPTTVAALLRAAGLQTETMEDGR